MDLPEMKQLYNMLNQLKNIYNTLNKVNYKGLKFNKKYLKNLKVIEDLVSQMEKDLTPLPEYKKYQEAMKNADSKNIISIQNAFKSTLKKQQQLIQEARKKYALIKLDLEEFYEDELPEEIETQVLKIMYQLDLVKERPKEDKLKATDEKKEKKKRGRSKKS